MIVVLSDTHGTGGHRLTANLREAVSAADLVVHAGDFVVESVLDAFESVAPSLAAVHGNVDEPAVAARLPAARTVEYEGLRIALTHQVPGGETALALFGRERDADLVVSGHSHRPSFVLTDEVALLNPGSHAQPRGNRPGYAALEVSGSTVHGRLCEPGGTVFEEFSFDRSR